MAPVAAVIGADGAIRATDCMTGDPVGEVAVYTAFAGRPVDVGPREDPYLFTARSFERAVAGQGRSIVSGRDGVRSLAAALAAMESLSTGCAQEVPRV